MEAYDRLHEEDFYLVGRAPGAEPEPGPAGPGPFDAVEVPPGATGVTVLVRMPGAEVQYDFCVTDGVPLLERVEYRGGGGE